jgi:hypothetical protein
MVMEVPLTVVASMASLKTAEISASKVMSVAPSAGATELTCGAVVSAPPPPPPSPPLHPKAAAIIITIPENKQIRRIRVPDCMVLLLCWVSVANSIHEFSGIEIS